MTNYFKSKNVLVTGSAGFVGTNLIKRLLLLGADLTATFYEKRPFIEDDDIRYIQSDLRFSENCMEVCENIDYIFPKPFPLKINLSKLYLILIVMNLQQLSEDTI